MQAAVIEHTLPVAEQPVESGNPLAAKMQMEASLVCVRALLTTGRDADAVRLAQQVHCDTAQLSACRRMTLDVQ